MFSVKNMHVYKLTEGLFFQEIYQKLIIPKKYFQNLEPLHKNDLVHESWVKVEFSHEKPVPKMMLNCLDSAVSETAKSDSVA